jgi:hypothetical protein
MNPLFFIHLFVVGLAGLAAWNLRPQGTGTEQRGGIPALILAFAVMALAVGGYTNLGTSHGSGKLWHFSEMWHYYLGSKYAPELGPYNLYRAIATAKEELGLPQDEGVVRNQRQSFELQPINEVVPVFRADGIERFEPERWEEFRQDVKDLAESSEGLNWPLHDMAYNPPPTYSALVGNISEWIRPTPEGMNVMASVDWMLAMTALLLVWRTFGTSSALLLTVVFCTNPLSNWFWIGAAYFRNIEFLCLCCAMCALQTKRFFWAGAALGIATGARIFPFVFIMGALLPMAADFARSREWEKLKAPALLSAGAGAALILMATAALVHQGPSNLARNWKDHAEKISAHKDIMFVYHIGAKKILAGTADDPMQDFRTVDKEMTTFDQWNSWQWQKIREKWSGWWAFSLIAWGLVLFVCSRESPRTSMLIIGESTLFLFTLPANYYYILLAVFAANAAADPDKPGHPAKIAVVLAGVACLNLVTGFFQDGIEINYWHNIALAGMLTSYLGVTAWLQIKAKGWPEGADRRRTAGLILAMLLPVALLTWSPPQGVKTRTLETAIWKDFIPKAGEMWGQSIPKVGPRVIKTQALAKTSEQGEITIEGYLHPKEKGTYEIAVDFTTAPDYVGKAELEIEGKRLEFVPKGPTLGAETASLTAELDPKNETNPGGKPNPIKFVIRGQGSPGELLGIAAVMLKNEKIQ